MKKINWDSFAGDEAAQQYLQSLPHYQNTALKSAFCRGKFFFKLLGCRLFKVDNPLFVALITNSKCNMKCTYCYGEYGNPHDDREFSTIELLKLIDALKELGTCLLTMHGGESLLRKDIGQLLNYVKLQGFYISLNTNGYRVRQRIEELKCIDTAVVSLDGSEEVHDKNRGKGSFKVAMGAIDCFVANNVPCVISATLTRDSMADIEYLARLGKEKGFRVQFSMLYNYADLKKRTPGLVLSDQEIRNAARMILQLKRNGYPLYFSDEVLMGVINWPFSLEEKRFLTRAEKDLANGLKLIPCYHGKLKYIIDADGRVIPCFAHNDPDAPNVKALSVAEAIKQCHDAQQCEHCVFMAYNEHNAVMHLSLLNILNIIKIHNADAYKMRRRGNA
jgi:MoaA/NifB/PqqE/SkfB family radical SAM enzyme